MQGNEGKMICGELKGIRKELSSIAREICLARQQEAKGNPESHLKIVATENGKPKYAELNGEYYRLEPAESPPGTSLTNYPVSTGRG